MSTRPAISFCLAVELTAAASLNHSPARFTDSSETSPICRPPIFTHSASGLSRKPWQALAGHVGEIACASSSRAHSLSVSRKRRSRLVMTPSNGSLGVVGAHAVVIGKADLVVAGAVEDRVLRLLRQVLPFGVERELVVLAERLQRLHVIGRRRFRPGRDGALAQGALLVGNDEVGVDMLLDAEPAAFRAGAERIVEREQPRLDFRNGEAGHRAGEFLREDEPLGPLLSCDFRGLLVGLAPAALALLARPAGGVGEFGDREPVGELQRCSSNSASALAMSGRTTMRSTTTSMSWVNFLSSAGASAIS